MIYTTNQETGSIKYSTNFINSTLLVRFHYFNAGQQDADHIHEGNGFLTQHLKLTNMFET
jgi:hypothetical protein